MTHLASKLRHKPLPLLSYLMHVVVQQSKWIISAVLQLRKSEAELTYPCCGTLQLWIGIPNQAIR